MTSDGLDECYSEQCSNRLEFDLISLLVNFSCELEPNNVPDMTSHGLCGLGQIMVIYNFLWVVRVILSNVRTDFQLDLFSILVNFLCELEPNNYQI